MDTAHCNPMYCNELKASFPKPTAFRCPNAIQMVVSHIIKSTISSIHIYLAIRMNPPPKHPFWGPSEGLCNMLYIVYIVAQAYPGNSGILRFQKVCALSKISNRIHCIMDSSGCKVFLAIFPIIYGKFSHIPPHQDSPFHIFSFACSHCHTTQESAGNPPPCQGRLPSNP